VYFESQSFYKKVFAGMFIVHSSCLDQWTFAQTVYVQFVPALMEDGAFPHMHWICMQQACCRDA
jgi:hypothetical protein